MKNIIVLGLLALALCLPAKAGLYPFSSDSGPILPNQGNNLSFSHTLSGMGSSIQDVLVTLDFTSQATLNGGILGKLYLGSGGSQAYASLTPTAPTYRPPSDFYCTLDFNQSSVFAGMNPNDQWTLNLWDMNTTFGNELLGWSLDITAVPEPVNVALAVFAALAGGIKLVSWRRKLSRTSPAA